jgi:hypothetical protein
VLFGPKTFNSTTTRIGDGFGQGIIIFQYSSLAEITFELEVVNAVINQVPILYGRLPPTGALNITNRVGLLVATPNPATFENLPQGLGSTLLIDTLDDVRIHLVQGFRPDVDAGATRDRAFAESFFTTEKSAVSNVRISGIGAVAPRLTIAPLSGASLTATVARIGFTLTTEGGAQTVYYVEQAFSADEEAQRVVLERLSRRAVKEGGQA